MEEIFTYIKLIRADKTKTIAHNKAARLLNMLKKKKELMYKEIDLLHELEMAIKARQE